MSLVNYTNKEINIKLVYYGPGLSGKTTNLEAIHKRLNPDNRGKLISLATETDRTLFFDFMPVNVGEIKGFQTRFHLYTVPGQVHYNETRKMVLKGTDGVVFVADSQPQMMEENIESLKNLEENLKEYDRELKDVPFVIQYNKRDLENVADVEDLRSVLNHLDVPDFEAEALNGKGILETFTNVSKLALKKMKEKPNLDEEERADEDELLTRLMEKVGEEEAEGEKTEAASAGASLEEEVTPAPEDVMDEEHLPEQMEIDESMSQFAYDDLVPSGDECEKMEQENGEDFSLSTEEEPEEEKLPELPSDLEMETNFEIEADELSVSDESIDVSKTESVDETESEEDLSLSVPDESGEEQFQEMPSDIEVETGFEMEPDGISAIDESSELTDSDTFGEHQGDSQFEESLSFPEEMEVDTDDIEAVVGKQGTGEVSETAEAVDTSKLLKSLEEKGGESVSAFGVGEKKSEEVTFGFPENMGGGRFSIPIIVDTEGGSREFNLNLTLGIERITSEEPKAEIFNQESASEEKVASEDGTSIDEPPMRFESTVKNDETEESAGISMEPEGDGGDTSFLDEVGEEFSKEPDPTDEEKEEEEIVEEKKKKGLFGKLFGRKG